MLAHPDKLAQSMRVAQSSRPRRCIGVVESFRRLTKPQASLPSGKGRFYASGPILGMRARFPSDSFGIARSGQVPRSFSERGRGDRKLGKAPTVLPLFFPGIL